MERSETLPRLLIVSSSSPHRLLIGSSSAPQASRPTSPSLLASSPPRKVTRRGGCIRKFEFDRGEREKRGRARMRRRYAHFGLVDDLKGRVSAARLLISHSASFRGCRESFELICERDNSVEAAEEEAAEEEADEEEADEESRLRGEKFAPLYSPWRLRSLRIRVTKSEPTAEGRVTKTKRSRNAD
ncbi:hypothetical protein EYF80_056347 [Liparis tanakae]|uniref:Uncharacterized protein n=1 Tax=Liparis tanakae TaxID=230148 RepID=A0A4Z2EXL2_9TELE|nr:hypothetical protein EYF80_056347 [Liparis tanakae]